MVKTTLKIVLNNKDEIDNKRIMKKNWKWPQILEMRKAFFTLNGEKRWNQTEKKEWCKIIKGENKQIR